MKLILRIVALQLIVVPISFLVGKAILYTGGGNPGLNVFVVLMGKAAFLFAGVHALLVWPLYQFGEKDLSQIKSESLRALICFSLLALPLLSFTVLFSQIKSWVDLFETILLVGPPVFIASLYFVKAKKPLLVSALISIPLFTGLFLVSDMMGPFPTRFQYLADANFVLYSKVFAFSSAVCLAFFSLEWEDRVSTVTDLLIALALSVPIAFAAVPFIQKSLAIPDLRSLPLTDLFWVGLLVIGIVSKLRMRAGDIFVRVWALGLAFYAVFGCLRVIQDPDTLFVDLQRLVLYFISMVFLFFLSFRPVAARTPNWALTPVSES